MRLIDLKTAAVEIRQAIEQNKEQLKGTPFCFMAGAGISHPPLPLASQVEQHCKLEAAKYPKPAGLSAAAAPIDSYSHWFEQAYPQPQNRQFYLRNLMEKAVISRANFRLAHLLLENTITNLVLTSNFDDFLARALDLFGRRHIVCDHPKTLERIDVEAEDLQVIHVHGSYWFYDCCNLKAEISERAKHSPDTSITMLATLDHILATRSPLVVGYSGWEGDVFMAAIKRRLDAPLRTNIYWFCHKRKQVESLPQWLTEHRDVRLVVPDERTETEKPAATRSDAEEGQASSHSGPETKEPVLDAIAVFDELIQQFDLKPPPLTQDPAAFFAKQLRDSLIGSTTDTIETDVYAISSVIDRLEKASQRALLQFATVEEEALEAVRNAIRQSNHRQAIQLANEITLAKLSGDQLRELQTAMVGAAEALLDDSADEMRAYDLIIAIGDRLNSVGGDDLASRNETARALLNKGLTFSNLNRSEEEIAAYDELLRRFADAPELALRGQVAKALRNKAITLGALNRSEEAIAAYDELLRRFADAPEPALRKEVAKALLNKGVRLGILNRNEEAIAAYDDLLQRVTAEAEPASREQVAKALRNKGNRLRTMSRSEEAIAAYDDLLRRFAEAPEATLREQVAKAMVNKGATLADLNRSEEAIAVYDDLVQRFADALDPALREQVAGALLNEGSSLDSQHRSEEAIAVYDDIIGRFIAASEPALQKIVKEARERRDTLKPPE